MVIKYIGEKNGCPKCKLSVSPTYAVIVDGIKYRFLLGMEMELPDNIGERILRKYDFFKRTY